MPEQMQVKMNPKKPVFTWSPTSIKVFQTCQLKAWGTWWSPTPPPYVETAATVFGKKVHKYLEDAVKDGRPLPSNLKHLEKWVESVHNMVGDKICEGKFAFNKDWKRVDYFADDVWGRMVIDLRVQREQLVSTIIDWKTGKSRYEDEMQIELGILAAHAMEPDTHTYNGTYIYTEEDKMGQMISYTNADVQWLKNKYNRIIGEMEDAFNTKIFNLTKNGLCKQYCDVRECRFNGRR